MPKNGTHIIYIEVIKPDFAAVVYLRPKVCTVLAAHRISPQIMPPAIKVFLSVFCIFFFLPEKNITGKSTAPPIAERIPIKVLGPI